MNVGNYEEEIKHKTKENPDKIIDFIVNNFVEKGRRKVIFPVKKVTLMVNF